MNKSPEEVAAFLKELSKLSSKHGIVIRGCGCCDSPYLSYQTYDPGLSNSRPIGEGEYTSYDPLWWEEKKGPISD